MSHEAFLLIVIGALCHAWWNALAKKVAGGLPFVWLFGLVSLTVALPVGLPLLIEGAGQLNALAWLAIVASALIHLGYSLVLQKGYQVSDFSIVYPLARGSGPLFAVFGAILVLGEMPSLLGWIGIVTILLGVFLIAGANRLLAGGPAVLPGVYWGCLTGLFIAAYTVLDGWVVKGLGVAPVLYYVLVLALRTFILAPQALRQRPALLSLWGSNRREIIAVGILSPLAYILVLFAMTRAPLSYVAPIRELSMLIGLIIGARFLRETLTATRLIGTGLMISGVVCLLFAR